MSEPVPGGINIQNQPVPSDDLQSDSSNPLSKPKRRGLKKAVVFFVVCLIGLYLFRYFILRSMGNSLVYESEPVITDAIAVLSGGGTVRLEKAIELYQTGLSKRIFITLPEIITEEMPYRDLLETEKRMCIALLELRGIPPDSVYWSLKPCYSTYTEAVLVHSWLNQNQLRSVTVVPGLFQSRRAKWCMDRAFRESGYDYRIAPAPQSVYSATNWWTHEEGIITVENEYLKNVYYRISGFFGASPG